MPRKKLPEELLPSFVRLKTTPDMRHMAKMFLAMKGGARDVSKTAKQLGSMKDMEDTDRLIRELASACADSHVDADEMIVLLEKVSEKLNRYLRSM